VCLLTALLVASLGQAQAAPGARNVILMISDGAGFNHFAAASLYHTGRPDGEVCQSFPVRLAATTFAVGGSYAPAQFWVGFDYAKTGATDSAAAATALACGVKTKNGALGVDTAGRRVLSVAEAAEASGRSSGVLTSVPFSHATPAGFGAHVASRGDYARIARQMISHSALDVIIGAGHPWYDDNGKRLDTPKYAYLGEPEWQALQQGTAGGDANGDLACDPWQLVQTKAELQAVLRGRAPSRLFGLMQAGSTLQEGRDSPEDNPAETALPFSVPLSREVPSLPEMTRAALRVLGSNPKGFFLMVEGGAVDWAGHSNFAGRMIEEQMDFGDAVAAVVRWVEANSSWGETLLIVTADHETGCLTGPGSETEWKPLAGKGKGQVPGMEWHSRNHTNSLVPVYARGVGASLLRRAADQQDPVRGPYLDNTEIGAVMRAVLR
jgi:alkaline phosphatase